MTHSRYGKMSTSSGIRGIRRKKSSLSEVKIGIIGSPGVGKSALAVRFLTKRYIGEYDHQSGEKFVNPDAIGRMIKTAHLFQRRDTSTRSWSMENPSSSKYATHARR